MVLIGIDCLDEEEELFHCACTVQCTMKLWWRNLQMPLLSLSLYTYRLLCNRLFTITVMHIDYNTIPGVFKVFHAKDAKI